MSPDFSKTVRKLSQQILNLKHLLNGKNFPKKLKKYNNSVSKITNGYFGYLKIYLKYLNI